MNSISLMIKEKKMDTNRTEFTGKLLHICEVCGRTEILTPQEAYDAGWDYPPVMGTFGILSPRSCPNCDMRETAWAALMLRGVNQEELTERQKQTIERVVSEPDSIRVPGEE